MTSKLILVVFAALVAGCGVQGAAPRATPTVPATSAGFALLPGQSYVIWRVGSVSAPVVPTVWCSFGSEASSAGCTTSGLVKHRAPYVEVSGQPGADFARIALPGGGAVDIQRVTDLGYMVPAVRRASRTQIAVKKPPAPAFNLVPGKVTYVGSYSEGPGFFSAGTWDPNGLKAELEAAGRGDIARALAAYYPQNANIACQYKSCRILPGTGDYPGFVRK